MVLVICTTSLRFAQLMYRPLRVFKTKLVPKLWYVYTLNICHYDVHEVSIMDGRVQ